MATSTLDSIPAAIVVRVGSLVKISDVQAGRIGEYLRNVLREHDPARPVVDLRDRAGAGPGAGGVVARPRARLQPPHVTCAGPRRSRGGAALPGPPRPRRRLHPIPHGDEKRRPEAARNHQRPPTGHQTAPRSASGDGKHSPLPPRGEGQGEGRAQKVTVRVGYSTRSPSAGWTFTPRDSRYSTPLSSSSGSPETSSRTQPWSRVTSARRMLVTISNFRPTW